VLGVDASGGVWYLERTSHNELDWSDTTWIKLLEGAAVEKPAVASRHANHIGVVVKDSTGTTILHALELGLNPKSFSCPGWYVRPWGQPGSSRGGNDSANIRDCFGPPGLVTALPTG